MIPDSGSIWISICLRGIRCGFLLLLNLLLLLLLFRFLFLLNLLSLCYRSAIYGLLLNLLPAATAYLLLIPLLELWLKLLLRFCLKLLLLLILRLPLLLGLWLSLRLLLGLWLLLNLLCGRSRDERLQLRIAEDVLTEFSLRRGGQKG